MSLVNCPDKIDVASTHFSENELTNNEIEVEKVY